MSMKVPAGAVLFKMIGRLEAIISSFSDDADAATDTIEVNDYINHFGIKPSKMHSQRGEKRIPMKILESVQSFIERKKRNALAEYAKRWNYRDNIPFSIRMRNMVNPIYDFLYWTVTGKIKFKEFESDEAFYERLLRRTYEKAMDRINYLMPSIAHTVLMTYLRIDEIKRIV